MPEIVFRVLSQTSVSSDYGSASIYQNDSGYPPTTITDGVNTSYSSAGISAIKRAAAYGMRIHAGSTEVLRLEGDGEKRGSYTIDTVASSYSVTFYDANGTYISGETLDASTLRGFNRFTIRWSTSPLGMYYFTSLDEIYAEVTVKFPEYTTTLSNTSNYRTVSERVEVTYWRSLDDSRFAGPPGMHMSTARDHRMVYDYEVLETEVYYEYLIRFNNRGGTGTIPQINLRGQPDASMNITMPTAEPTLTDFTFVGWSTTSYEPGQGSAEYYAGQTYQMNYGLTQLYAVYASKISVKANVNGAWMQTKPYVKVDGQWREVTGVKVKVNGEWKDTTQ